MDYKQAHLPSSRGFNAFWMSLKTTTEMKLKILILTIVASFSVNGQIDTSLLRLVKQTNTYFQEHINIHPDFGLVSLEKHHLTFTELFKTGIISQAAVSKNKDSVHSIFIVEYYAFRIKENIDKIFNHPAAIKLDFLSYFDAEYSNSWVSEDGKFAQISYYSNNGGTYQMQETYLIYKTHKDSLSFAHLNKINGTGVKSKFENFRNDGYARALEIKDSKRTKYVLFGGVKGCSLCYYEWISLVYFDGEEFIFEFDLEVATRDFSGSIEYNSEKKEVKVKYKTNDLTETCACALIDDTADYIDLEAEAAVTPENTSCYCHFIYNGKTFELYDGIITLPDNED